MKPAHIPHKMQKEVEVQIGKWHQGGSLMIWRDRQTKNDKTSVCCCIQRVYVSNVPTHLPHHDDPKSQSAVKFE